MQLMSLYQLSLCKLVGHSHPQPFIVSQKAQNDICVVVQTKTPSAHEL